MFQLIKNPIQFLFSPKKGRGVRIIGFGILLLISSIVVDIGNQVDHRPIIILGILVIIIGVVNFIFSLFLRKSKKS